MRQQIVDLINERGEMTFRELCCELNMFNTGEVLDVKKNVCYMLRWGMISNLGPLGDAMGVGRMRDIIETNVHPSAILKPALVGIR